MERTLERTLVIIKPNAVQRGLLGEIISRMERRGLKITAMKLCAIQPETAEVHYREHLNKSFYQRLVDFITCGPSVIMILESPHVVSVVRTMVGDTNPVFAATGSIRGDYATLPERNLIHASDSVDSAEREISIFFSDEEIQNYTLAVRPWL